MAELRQVARETNSQSQQDAFATQKRYNLATETLVDELRQWEVSRGEEIKQIVRCYSDAMIKGHREVHFCLFTVDDQNMEESVAEDWRGKW